MNRDAVSSLAARIEQKGYRAIYVVGGPGSGKTTLAENLTAFLDDSYADIHGDDIIRLPWDQQPAAVAQEFALYERFVAEGINVSRALRKHPDKCPTGLVVVCTRRDRTANPGRDALRARFEEDLVKIRTSRRGHTILVFDEYGETNEL